MHACCVHGKFAMLNKIWNIQRNNYFGNKLHNFHEKMLLEEYI